jgi:hypothetical protein
VRVWRAERRSQEREREAGKKISSTSSCGDAPPTRRPPFLLQRLLGDHRGRPV